MSVLELVGERRALKQVMHIASGWAKVAAWRQATAAPSVVVSLCGGIAAVRDHVFGYVRTRE